MKRYLITAMLGLMMTSSGFTHAAIVFITDTQGNPAKLTIENYHWYYDGSNAVFEVKVKEAVSTGCAATDASRIFSYWVPSANVFQQVLQAQAANAEAQGRKINLQYDNAQCSSTAGRYLYGVRVLNAADSL